MSSKSVLRHRLTIYMTALTHDRLIFIMEILVHEKEKKIFVCKRIQGMSKLVQPDSIIAWSYSIAHFIQYRNDHSRYPDCKVQGPTGGSPGS